MICHPGVEKSIVKFFNLKDDCGCPDEREVFDALIETVMRDGRCRPEASHGTGVRELTANEAAKVQWAMGQYHVLVLMGNDPKHGSERTDQRETDNNRETGNNRQTDYEHLQKRVGKWANYSFHEDI